MKGTDGVGTIGQEALVALAEDEVVDDAVTAVDDHGRAIAGGQGADIVLGVVGKGVRGTFGVPNVDRDAIAHDDVPNGELVLGAADALFKGVQAALDVGHAGPLRAPLRHRRGG